jgi:hypothetical protein
MSASLCTPLSYSLRSLGVVKTDSPSHIDHPPTQDHIHQRPAQLILVGIQDPPFEVRERSSQTCSIRRIRRRGRSLCLAETEVSEQGVQRERRYAARRRPEYRTQIKNQLGYEVSASALQRKDQTKTMQTQADETKQREITLY